MSVCYKTLSILYILAVSSYTIFPHSTDRLLASSPYLIHYNHFHYGNRIQSQSSAIPIMHNYSSELYNYSFELHKYSFFGFHYGNHLLIIGFYYGIRLWDFHFIISIYAYARVYMGKK